MSLEEKRELLTKQCQELLDRKGARNWDSAAQSEYDRYIAEIDRIDRELYGFGTAEVQRITEHVIAELRRADHAYDPETELLHAVDALAERDGRATAVQALRDLANELEADIDYDQNDDDSVPDDATVARLLRRRT